VSQITFLQIMQRLIHTPVILGVSTARPYYDNVRIL
jgi:hypothetical protein